MCAPGIRDGRRNRVTRCQAVFAESSPAASLKVSRAAVTLSCRANRATWNTSEVGSRKNKGVNSRTATVICMILQVSSGSMSNPSA